MGEGAAGADGMAVFIQSGNVTSEMASGIFSATGAVRGGVGGGVAGGENFLRRNGWNGRGRCLQPIR